MLTRCSASDILRKNGGGKIPKKAMGGLMSNKMANIPNQKMGAFKKGGKACKLAMGGAAKVRKGEM
jgi:hypothetical protein